MDDLSLDLETVDAQVAAVPRWTKTCPCCGHVYSRSQWRRLPLVGFQPSEDETGRYQCELRDCQECFSTIGVERRLP